jgi:hypothetical protein
MRYLVFGKDMLKDKGIHCREQRPGRWQVYFSHEGKQVYHQRQKLIQVWVIQEEFLKVKLLCSQYGLRSISYLLRLFINSPPGQIYIEWKHHPRKGVKNNEYSLSTDSTGSLSGLFL